jgi:CHAT domain-containing protein
MQGESFVAERFSFHEARSLRLIESLRSSREPPTGMVACVNPRITGVDLPSEADTALVLEKTYGGKSVTLSGVKCTKSNLVGALNSGPGSIVLHLGTPANLYTENVMDAALMLSAEGQGSQNGEPWNAKGIAMTDMSKVDLLTVSHSEARIPKIKSDRDRESLGILRPLFFAGVKQVLAPRWQVHQDASAELLQAFHLAYAKNHNAPLALQNAQAAVRRNDKYAHPHFWSAFVLTTGVQQ